MLKNVLKGTLSSVDIQGLLLQEQQFLIAADFSSQN